MGTPMRLGEAGAVLRQRAREYAERLRASGKSDEEFLSDDSVGHLLIGALEYAYVSQIAAEQQAFERYMSQVSIERQAFERHDDSVLITRDGTFTGKMIEQQLGILRSEQKCTDWEVVLDSGRCTACGVREPEIQPGETRFVHHMTQVHFRAELAQAVEGVDLGAFEVEQAFVGSLLQFRGRPEHPARRRATVLLEGLRLRGDLSSRGEDGDEKHLASGEDKFPFDTCKAVLTLGLQVTNRSDKAQRFAIKLVGKALR